MKAIQKEEAVTSEQNLGDKTESTREKEEGQVKQLTKERERNG